MPLDATHLRMPLPVVFKLKIFFLLFLFLNFVLKQCMIVRVSVAFSKNCFFFSKMLLFQGI